MYTEKKITSVDLSDKSSVNGSSTSRDRKFSDAGGEPSPASIS